MSEPAPYGAFAESYEEYLRAEKERAAEKEKAKAAEKARLAREKEYRDSCYRAIKLESGKFQCPICKGTQGGTVLVITHQAVDNKPCPNSYKAFCQQFNGGRRKTRKLINKKRKNRRRTSRRN